METEGACALAAVTWHELRYGVQRLPTGRRRDALTAWLQLVDERYAVLAYDRTAAEWHAEERARLMATGESESAADGQIAAVAATNGLTLVTRNLADFARYQGVAVESWWD